MNHISISDLQLIGLANLASNDEQHDSCSASPESRLVVCDKITVNFRIRLFLFCLIEAGFIILASVCLARPLPIMLRLSDSKMTSWSSSSLTSLLILSVENGLCN